MAVYAIGDVHGQIIELERALDLIARDGGEGAPVVFLGDYVDRGPDSRAVVARLLEGCKAGRPWTVLKGNHDRMFTRFVRDMQVKDARILSGKTWLHPALGGMETLASYFDVDAVLELAGRSRGDVPEFGRAAHHDPALASLWSAAAAAVPRCHLTFLEGLSLSHLDEDAGVLFVHAGVHPRLPLAWQSEDDLLWIREPWLSDPGPHPWLVVHGHTALEHPTHHGVRINVDGGAGYGRPLVPVVLEADRVCCLTDGGRAPLM